MLVRKDNVVRLGSAMRAGFRLVKRSHPDRADVAGSVVARRNCSVLHRRGANEADFGIVVHCLFNDRLCDAWRSLCIFSFCHRRLALVHS